MAMVQSPFLGTFTCAYIRTKDGYGLIHSSRLRGRAWRCLLIGEVASGIRAVVEYAQRSNRSWLWLWFRIAVSMMEGHSQRSRLKLDVQGDRLKRKLRPASPQ